MAATISGKIVCGTWESPRTTFELRVKVKGTTKQGFGRISLSDEVDDFDLFKAINQSPSVKFVPNDGEPFDLFVTHAEFLERNRFLDVETSGKFPGSVAAY